MTDYHKNNKYLPLVIGLLGLLILILPACGRPTLATTPMELPEEYEIADDFTHPNNAWARFDSDETAVYSLAGELYLEDRGQGLAVISPLSGKAYLDQTVDLQIRHVQGSVNNWMGVVMRMQDDNNYYLTAISADGFMLVLEVVDGLVTPVYGPEQNEAIHTGKAENHLRIELDGNALSAWVNDELAASVDMTSISMPGETALFADAVNTRETVVVAFDDFLLTLP